MWRVLGNVLYASSLIVTLPILGLGVMFLIGMAGDFDLSAAALIFAGWVIGGVLGVAGLIANGIRQRGHSRLYVVATGSCLIAGTATCGTIAVMLLWNLDTAWIASPFTVLSIVGVVKTVALLRKDDSLSESAAGLGSKAASMPALSIAQTVRCGSDTAPLLLLGLACLLAIVVLAMHLAGAA